MADRKQCELSLAKRLQGTIPQIEKVQSLCQVPSISFGVLHRGETFCHSIGYRDANLTLKADSDTIYMLGSCSKMLTSAAMGILVDAGKMSWQEPVRKYIPKFGPVGDPHIREQADFIDLLRHSSGIGDAGRLCLGPSGSILVDENDLIPLLNMMSTSNDQGQRFNKDWAYNNIAYGIVAKAIENVSGQRFDKFVKEQILQPLKMTRTAVAKSDIVSDDNVASSCATLANGQFVELDTSSWPCEDVSPLLAAAGIRSSVNDVLKWCAAVLSAERNELSRMSQGKHAKSSSATGTLMSPGNPLKQMTRVRRGYWTRPADDPSTSKHAAYCMGWVRMELPSSTLSSFSGNSLSRKKDYQMHIKPEFILGKGSNPFLMIGHSGGMPGSLATIWTFPETQSAVVVMTNGRGLGDASDFAAQILTQALLDLNPQIDLFPWVELETKLVRNYFETDLLAPWMENRFSDDLQRDPELYVGNYVGFRGLFAMIVTRNANGDLVVLFNHRQASSSPLIFYRCDVYSFFTPDYDYWVTRGAAVSKYEETLLEFKLDQAQNRVEGLHWLWNSDEDREWFKRID
ncbi:hypothetical protein N7532_003557 [Penicillium argentinense]|uniref:Beta-lactamase-related domain-containing protein n=1 Tax=Penicillium argentinense TaxID=1131581 RepID=A0A9W9FMP6_9EURO|nr:uncharacterized protein N7532_003557 [Penicillium argentinense]KAJ5103028.1 hypothetical protein N7532_003557 [Penicillium argentinense]